MRVLKILRFICFMPFIIWLIIALYYALIRGVSFGNSPSYGYDAFVIALIAYGVSFFWVGVICIIGIVVISILLAITKRGSEQENEEKKDTNILYRESVEIMEYVCNMLCKHPQEATDQEKLDDICTGCKLDGYVQAILQNQRKGRKRIGRRQ